jgi:phosphohistidine phosphatase
MYGQGDGATMDRLILLRHGDAEPGSESGDDFDRRLSERGRAESAHVAETLCDLGLAPDLVVASAAARTRETWATLSQSFPQAQVRFEDALYLAEPEQIRDVVRACSALGTTVLVVGHNPGLQELALALMIEGGAAGHAIERIRGRFPTAGAAVFLIDPSGRPTADGVFFPHDRT